jgi:hypothetical protein
VVVLLVVLDTEPEVAEPPVVLSLTLALPLLRCWAVTLKVATLVLLSTWTLLELSLLMVLLELGPVVSIESVLLPPPEPLPAQLLPPLLSKLTLVAEAWLVLTSPLVAPPAVVLWLELALPLCKSCKVTLPVTALFLLCTETLLLLPLLTVLCELGPVLEMLESAEATPRPRPRVAKPIELYRKTV